MEKSLSLNYDEATALLEMSVFTYAESNEAADSALVKLGDLWREFCADYGNIDPVDWENIQAA